MKEQNKIIFDMDGTLYRFDSGKSQSFVQSQFYGDIKTNIYTFLMAKLGIDKEEALREYERVKTTFRGEVSIGLETEYQINRYEFFEATWNLNPENYLEKDEEIAKLLEDLVGRVALLTAAPRVWASRVLAYLQIEDIFGDAIYTGEPNLRKPNPLIFTTIAEDLGSPTRNVASIGDQEESDIVPAKSVGMKTVLIGKQEQSVADFIAPDIKTAISILKSGGFV